jgi:putative ABC transport system permease protein
MTLTLALSLARGGVAANPLRLALTIACIALGVALGVAVHTINASALTEIDRAARALAGRADLEVRGPRNGFDDARFVEIASLPEVAAASPVVEVDAAIPGRDDTLRVVGIDPFRVTRLQPALVAAGESTGLAQAIGLLDPKNAWLTPAAAQRLGLRIGDKFRTVSASGEVEWHAAGILEALSEGGDLAVVDIAAAQARLGRVGRLSRIDLRLHADVDRKAFAARLASTLPPGLVVAPAASAAGRAESLSRAYRVNLDALALVALATGAFLVFSTLALQAARRRQEFALLRALGVTRGGVRLLLALEAGAIGLAGAVLGTTLGLVASRELLARVGGDLGAGYFLGTSLFSPDIRAIALIGALGVLTALAGAIWVAHAVARIDVAEALRDRMLDLPVARPRNAWIALLLALGGAPLLFLPPVGEIPVGGYAAITVWLAAAVAAIDPLCRALLAHDTGNASVVSSLALAQVRHLPGHLAASVAGIVLSTSLCVAMAIMVHSFRVSFDEWLRGVVGADLYVRSGSGGDTGFFTRDEEERLASLPEVRALESLRYDRVLLEASGAPVSIVARPITERVLRGFRATSATPARDGEAQAWISEAARDLRGWKSGDVIELPLDGKPTRLAVAGVIRDYARTWGAVLIDIRDYRRITGDTRTNDFAIHLAPGSDVARAERAVREALPAARGLRFEDAVGIQRRSLELFDRSFTITYALEAIAILIGLAGVTSSFAALAWSRRREFGVLRFLGLRRREVLQILTLEGAATGALGAAIGLLAGLAISLVLVHIVNRQSFHWTLEMHWPVASVALLLGGVILLCALGARLSGAAAVRREAVLAVKEDA